MGDFRTYCLNLIEERRANLGNDLLSALIQVEEEGDRLSTDELVGLVQGMIAAGTDTTRNQLGIMISLLAERPETWSQLRNDKELIANTVEESLRYVNPIRTVIRQVAEEFEYRDVIFSPGQLITFSLSSANRDASEFDTADDFDVTRSDARNHLTFSSGIHHCLGAALARAELQEALQVFVETWSEVTPDASPTWKHGRLAIWGPKTVPLKVTKN
jgi:cytochrome P450